MTPDNRLLVLVRHGQSEWNLKNLFTGWKDPDLTPLGVEEAKAAGQRLKAKGLTFDVAYTSELSRAQKTCGLILDQIGQPSLQTIRDIALNERDYGELSGLDKAETAAKYGEAQVHIWRRSYDIAPPGGESLKDTVARTLPYFVAQILPRVMGGEKVLVAAHGNSLRALIMVLDRLSPDGIMNVELNTGEPIIYKLNNDTSVASKEILKA
jgi:2,3-bisphosphoglycerate-dependent phosphoglycerate mutase